jgi:multimeric flavodoxin WrbA
VSKVISKGTLTVDADLTNANRGKTESNKVKTKKRIFLNASKNRDGLTTDLAHQTLSGLDYKTINLVDYHIDQIGQESKSDAFFKVINQLSHADVLVIGTPVYWSDMTGYLKTFIDRLTGIMNVPLDSTEAPLRGADVYLIVQGTAPEDAIPGITNVIEHVCKRFFMNYKGLIRNRDEARAANGRLQ